MLDSGKNNTDTLLEVREMALGVDTLDKNDKYCGSLRVLWFSSVFGVSTWPDLLDYSWQWPARLVLVVSLCRRRPLLLQLLPLVP